jgi:hypothetical protein
MIRLGEDESRKADEDLFVGLVGIVRYGMIHFSTIGSCMRRYLLLRGFKFVPSLYCTVTYSCMILQYE